MIRETQRTRCSNRPSWSQRKLESEQSRLLQLSISLNTSKSYASAFNAYSSFCETHNLDIDPTPDTLSLFISYISHFINPRSVSAYLSGVCHTLEPAFPHVRQAQAYPIVVRTLQGAMRSRGTPSRRAQALTIDDLRRIVRHYRSLPSSLDNSLFIALLLTGFFGLLRLCEITKPTS